MFDAVVLQHPHHCFGASQCIHVFSTRCADRAARHRAPPRPLSYPD
ncbi:hypothetical protein AX27061_0829 [Achromobacter xylosoxidans NBRC 15126 = ATCC 27061]|nr:hypothetical protein AX27061_0829 [Achromobacter xylosoxidans NBRC 15126 = ATCC 27061]